jgi:hypothetical protein
MAFNFADALDIVAPRCEGCGKSVTKDLKREWGGTWHRSCFQEVQKDLDQIRRNEEGEPTPQVVGICPICRENVMGDSPYHVINGRPVHSHNCAPQLEGYVKRATPNVRRGNGRRLVNLTVKSEPWMVFPDETPQKEGNDYQNR